MGTHPPSRVCTTGPISLLRDYIKAASPRWDRISTGHTCPAQIYHTAMKYFAVVALTCLVACIAAAPVDEPIPILRSTFDGPNPDGSYAYSYETGNGIQAEEQGELKPEGDEGTASVRGSYSYVADDGTPIQVSYVADENGFQPQGAHLPVAPAIPEAILKALEWIALHPEEDNLK